MRFVVKRVIRLSVIIPAVLFLLLVPSISAFATPTLEWVQTYSDALPNSSFAFGVTADSSGNAYVAGYEYLPDGSTAQAWVRKYDTSGNALWTQTYRYDSANYTDSHDVALDASGNVYVVGHADNIGWTNKYDPDGNPLWSETYSGGSIGFAIAVDAAGNAYSSVGSATLVKYDTDGNTLWTLNDAFIGTGAAGIAVDAMSNVVVTKTNGKIAKFDPDGNQLWATQVGPTHGFAITSSQGVITDAACNIYAFGYTAQRDPLLVKYDPDGNILWSRDLPFASASSVTIDSHGYVYATGQDLLLKYDADGNVIWTQTYDIPGSYSFHAYDIAVDSQDNIYLAGDYYSAITLVKYSQAIPEPATLVLLALGGIGFVVRRWIACR
jgi:hypothetical protein